MVRYELLKNLTGCVSLAKLTASGIVSISISTKLQVYETYLTELKNEKNKAVAVQSTADYYGFSIKHIYSVINFMES